MRVLAECLLLAETTCGQWFLVERQASKIHKIVYNDKDKEIAIAESFLVIVSLLQSQGWSTRTWRVCWPRHGRRTTPSTWPRCPAVSRSKSDTRSGRRSRESSSWHRLGETAVKCDWRGNDATCVRDAFNCIIQFTRLNLYRRCLNIT